MKAPTKKQTDLYNKLPYWLVVCTMDERVKKNKEAIEKFREMIKKINS